MFHKKEKEDDYVPKAFQKGKTNKKAKSKKKKKHIILVCFIILILCGIYYGICANRWKMLTKEMFANECSTVIDTKGNKIASIGCERKNKKIKLSNMPENLKNAYVAIEDERYYKHGGIDIKRTGAAIISYIIHFGKSSYGGSTITQQLVKNLTGDSTDSILRKIKEWNKACQLNSYFSKDEILEEYLNIIYVGPNMYGVETASNYYFNKSAKDLNLEECAFLAGINNSPNAYNPFEEKDNIQKITKRTKTVLAKMLELQYINEDTYNTAIKNVDSGLKFKKGEIKSEEALYSYHTDALILEITKDIAKKYHISEKFANNYINMAGLTIESTQDSKLQEKTEAEFKKNKYSIKSKIGKNSSQAAMVIIDHKTGYVVGCIGGLGEKTKARALNRATQSIRQTGSAIKPLAVLVPAIDKKIITATSIYDDTPRDFADGYHPTDYNPPLGNITVRRAVESSQNIPFVEIMEKLKPKNSIKYLKKMGISSLTKEDETLVLSLGGLQKGISPLEMASAYATIANDGEYIEPTFYFSIKDKSGNTILKSFQTKRKVVSKEVAYIVKSILTEPVMGKNGTATYCKISGVDVAAKTGTTDENYDRWLCGFTPYYTAVTWYGYDENETIEYNKRNPAGLLWANVMSRIHTGLKGATFEKINSVATCTICSETGKKATTGCKNTYTEYFLWLTLPKELCDKHTGSELKENTNNKETQNKIHEVIKEITQDIDAEDPQQVLPNNTKTNVNPQTNNTKNNTTTNNNKTTNKITNNANDTNNEKINNTNTNTNINIDVNVNVNKSNSTMNTKNTVNENNTV